MNTPGYEKLLKYAGGTQAAIAKLLDISDAAVNQWKGTVPPRSAIRAEQKTGGDLTRHDLRPDYFGVPASAPKPSPRPKKRAERRAVA